MLFTVLALRQKGKEKAFAAIKRFLLLDKL